MLPSPTTTRTSSPPTDVATEAEPTQALWSGGHGHPSLHTVAVLGCGFSAVVAGVLMAIGLYAGSFAAALFLPFGLAFIAPVPFLFSGENPGHFAVAYALPGIALTGFGGLWGGALFLLYLPFLSGLPLCVVSWWDWMHNIRARRSLRGTVRLPDSGEGDWRIVASGIVVYIAGLSAILALFWGVVPAVVHGVAVSVGPWSLLGGVGLVVLGFLMPEP